MTCATCGHRMATRVWCPDCRREPAVVRPEDALAAVLESLTDELRAGTIDLKDALVVIARAVETYR